eukprot:COSAG01_NODE_11136_length_1998_cov_3.843075_1_plen_149_part_00
MASASNNTARRACAQGVCAGRVLCAAHRVEGLCGERAARHEGLGQLARQALHRCHQLHPHPPIIAQNHHRRRRAIATIVTRGAELQPASQPSDNVQQAGPSRASQDSPPSPRVPGGMAPVARPPPVQLLTACASGGRHLRTAWQPSGY